MELNFSPLQAFVETARRGGFSAAAAHLGVSRAAVSKNVASIEQKFGVRLFNRTTRKVSLTEEGEAFLEQAMVALAAIKEGTIALGERLSEPSGLVRVTTATAFGRRYLLPLLPIFCERYPQVQVEISFDNQVVDLVSEGYDIAVRGGILKDSSMIARKLFDMVILVVGTPRYFERYGIPQTPGDLVRHQCVSFRHARGKRKPWTFERLGETHIHEPKGGITVSDPEVACQAALQGLGLASVALHHALPYLKAGQLRCALLDYKQPAPGVYLVYPHREQIAPKARVFIEHVAAAFEARTDLRPSSEELRRYAASLAPPSG